MHAIVAIALEAVTLAALIFKKKFGTIQFCNGLLLPILTEAWDNLIDQQHSWYRRNSRSTTI
jgi:hypothetical protein